jgi:hypothetical protein
MHYIDCKALQSRKWNNENSFIFHFLPFFKPHYNKAHGCEGTIQ